MMMMNYRGNRQQRHKPRPPTRDKMLKEIEELFKELDPYAESASAERHQQWQLLGTFSDARLSKMLKRLRSRKKNTRSLLYSSDWIVLVASLAGISRRHPRACIVALGFGNPKYMGDKYLDAGLLWVVRRNPSRRDNSSGSSSSSGGDSLDDDCYYGSLENASPFANALTKCASGTDFIVGVIALTTEVIPEKSHLLSYVLTRATGEFEVFDPNGGLQFVDDDSAAYNRFLDSYFQLRAFGRALQAFLKTGALKNVVTGSVVMPYDWCPPKGIQVLEETQLKKEGNATPAELDFGGYCGAWSIWWLQTRLASPPSADRAQLMTAAIDKFAQQRIPIRSWMLRFAQTLTDDTLRLLTLALRIGGRSPRQARALALRYARAKTACQKASNVLFGLEKAERKLETPSKTLEATRRRSQRICASMNRIIVCILSEAQASVRQAVTSFSRRRIVVL